MVCAVFRHRSAREKRSSLRFVSAEPTGQPRPKVHTTRRTIPSSLRASVSWGASWTPRRRGAKRSSSTACADLRNVAASNRRDAMKIWTREAAQPGGPFPGSSVRELWRRFSISGRKLWLAESGLSLRRQTTATRSNREFTRHWVPSRFPPNSLKTKEGCTCYPTLETRGCHA